MSWNNIIFEESVFVVALLVLDLGVLSVKHVKHLSDLRAMFLPTTSRNTASDLIQFLCDTLFHSEELLQNVAHYLRLAVSG